MGASGPTLNPRDSIDRARQSAIAALGASTLEGEVQAVTGTRADANSGFALSAQSRSGDLDRARIVALWSDPGSAASDRSRLVLALACLAGREPADLPTLPYPRWLIEPDPPPGRLCAMGLAGPTWDPEDQPARALEDARRALALSLESRVDERSFDRGGRAARIVRQVAPSEEALARASSAEALDRSWLDERGVGPVGLTGVLYGLACIDR